MSDATIAPAIVVSSSKLHLLAVWSKNLWTCSDLPQQQPNCDGGKKDIEQRERDERDDQSGHRRNRVSCSHHAVNNPWLSSDFRYYPAGFNCDEAERRSQDQRTQKPFGVEPSFRFVTPPPPVSPRSQKRDPHHRHSARDHDLKGYMHNCDRRTLRCGKIS